MKAALYLRVSTDMQVEDGFSLQAQVNELQKYCNNNNIEIYKVYADEGISGQKENRPQFQQMIKDAEARLFNVILVHKFDRFARKVELSHRIKAQLKKAGVNVLSMTEPVEDSPIGFFQEGILELLAEYYVRNLAKETKKGHVERARQGLHNGSIPYGYKRSLEHESGMVINEDQATVVKLIFDMYVNQGCGTTKISRYLNVNKIPCAVRGEWGHFTVNKILKNVKYTGMIYYDGEVYQGKHEAIIDKTTFETAEKFMNDRTWQREYRGYNYDKFLFLGFLRCGVCTRVFRIQKNTKSKTKRVSSLNYYICNSATHYDRTLQCNHGKYYSVAKLEEHILDYIKSIINGLEMDFEAKEDINIETIQANAKKQIEEQLDLAKRAFYAKAFSPEEYAAEKKRLEEELSQIKPIKIDHKERVRNKMQNLWERFEKAESIPEKKAILKEFIECIYVYPPGKIRIITY